jgi:hypothetical protein
MTRIDPCDIYPPWPLLALPLHLSTAYSQPSPTLATYSMHFNNPLVPSSVPEVKGIWLLPLTKACYLSLTLLLEHLERPT